MKSILNTIGIIITILAGFAAIFGVYLQLSANKPIIEIKTISSDKLTNLPNLDGLNASYTYKNKPVNSLWKLNYLISNIGNQTIIGAGNNKNIIKENIKFSLNENFKILELSILNKKQPIEIDFNDNNIDFSFLQWRPNENINIVIYVEQLNNQDIPNLVANDREIINGEIKYSFLSDEINNNDKILFYKLPQLLQTVLRWFTIGLFGFIAMIMPIVWIDTFIKDRNFNKWKIEQKESYNQFIAKLIEDKSLSEYVEPKFLPIELWAQYQAKIPKIPDNNLQEMTIGTLSLVGVSIIPLLLLLKW